MSSNEPMFYFYFKNYSHFAKKCILQKKIEYLQLVYSAPIYYILCVNNF